MKFDRNTDFRIAKNIIDSVFTKNKPLDYNKWVEFVDTNTKQFVWKEDTKEGVEILTSIDKIPKKFKKRILESLNKSACYKEFDESKGYYNINVGFNYNDNWIRIGFERAPNPEDLRIFLDMANYLDAYLLCNGKEIIDKKVVESLD